MNPLVIVDLETSGLDPGEHEIIEIGAILVDRTTLLSLGTLELKVLPTKPVSPDAARVNGYTEEGWKNAIPLSDAMKKFALFARDANMLAYNVSFDWGFLQEAFRKTGIRDTMRYQRLDILTIAWFFLPGLRSYSLKSVCEEVGVDPESDVHEAIKGAHKAFEVYTYIASRAKPLDRGLETPGRA